VADPRGTCEICTVVWNLGDELSSRVPPRHLAATVTLKCPSGVEAGELLTAMSAATTPRTVMAVRSA
jgi:hypothetical protein